jgi:hypothetical protein
VLEHSSVGGKTDDTLTALLIAASLLGLIAAGASRSLLPILAAVAVVGTAAPLVVDALTASQCPIGATGMDCSDESLAALFVVPALFVVLASAAIVRGRCARGTRSGG